MNEAPDPDKLEDPKDRDATELIVTGSRPSLDAIKRAIADDGVPGATPGTAVCRDWHSSLHVTYSAPRGWSVPLGEVLARLWRPASILLAFDCPADESGGYARWEAGERTALHYDDSYQGDGAYGDYVTVSPPPGGPDCAMITPRQLASMCLLARRFGWRPDEAILRALDATLDPIDAGRLEDEPEMDLAVATLPAEEAVRLADALRVARGCFGVPVEVLDGLGIRGDAPPGGAYGTGRADDLERTTLRTIREVLEAANAGVELLVQRTILARPARD